MDQWDFFFINISSFSMIFPPVYPDPDPDPLVLKPFGGLVHQSKKFFKLVCSMRG
jgi:hypothetical protein